jgi:EF-P beta-lysylation protein EpmB
MTRCETTNQSDEILTRRSDFVPTAFDRTSPESFSSLVDWQTAMKRAIRCSVQLRRELGLSADADEAGLTISSEKSFPTFVPREFLARIRPGDPSDPLLRQVLPIGREDAEAAGYSSDPVGDLVSIAAPGLLHKYDGRALMIASGACGVHCRYCFRREFPYSSQGSRTESWKPSLDYLRTHDEISEVLLSGGDPLTLTDSKLAELITQVESIEHVRRLRIHSRMPIVIPQRITARLLERLSSSRLAVWLVVHANHPNELDEWVMARIGAVVDAGIPVLNQAVLLRGVNDDPRVLKELCLKLVDHRIQPYYLHQLDRVRGASHFEVPIAEGKRIMEHLRSMLPGYAVPTYVTETPGAESKTPLS